MTVQVVNAGGVPANRMLEAFRETDGAVLFGVDSFWQGVDVQGEALSNVIITKLPFTPPDRPIVVVPAPLAKGLEFDDVIVVEPAEIAVGAHGVRLLFVALTRAVQHLAIAYSDALPPELT